LEFLSTCLNVLKHVNRKPRANNGMDEGEGWEGRGVGELRRGDLDEREGKKLGKRG
jgi:hypothetical protein